MKHFMKSSCFLAALCALLAFTACKEEKPAVIRVTNEKVVVPPAKAPAFLKKGDKIALVSPAYNTPDSNTYNTAEVLKEWGLLRHPGRTRQRLYPGHPRYKHQGHHLQPRRLRRHAPYRPHQL